MQLQNFPAPMYYLDGIPAYKVGEWYGHKSCKFGPTRRIVRPNNIENPILTGTHGVADIMPKKKHFEIKETQEYKFRPTCKLVNENYNRNEKIHSIKIVSQEITTRKERPERKHNFDYLVKRDYEISSKLNGPIEDNIKQEFSNIVKIGFVKPKSTTDYLEKIRKTQGVNNTIPKEDCSGREFRTLKQDKQYVKSIDKLPYIPNI